MKNDLGILTVFRRHHLAAWRALRSGSVCAGLAVLAACAPAPERDFRDQSVPITATTRFTPQAFDGTWHVIATYPNAFFPSCPAQRWQADTAADAPRLAVFCKADRAAVDAPLAVDPRGVMQVQSAGLDRAPRALWVMWMAEDRRTAVIGTPGGEMGWIVNRTPNLRPDRLTAARAIMAFNGYDIARIEEVGS